jgi:glycosyltransferase involved in cell wall biosynthesis
MVRLKDHNIELTIAGDGPEEQALRALAKDFSIGDRVRFLGYVANEDLRREYLEADLFVLPTLSEALGSVVLEAMSCGLPVIATDVGGIPEMIEDGVNGFLVPPGDAARLAQAISQLAANPLRRRAMRRANLERIATQFRWSANVDCYERIYQRVLAAAP